jgi:non-canonical purine NTP pyrophosphatase (RdgB/HAM1 family)
VTGAGGREPCAAAALAGASAGAARMPRTMYVATANRGKLHEMRALFAPHGIDVLVYPGYTSPPEGERSYAENAALKAYALHARLRAEQRLAGVLADDSGLEVYALDRRPGVVTADYGGPHATWPERRAKLLAELAARAGADRRARFVCSMHYIDPQGREFAALGTVDGEIAAAERGELGFSFDPVFLYPPAGRTFGELSDADKNRVSHRAIAAAAIVAAIDAAAVQLSPAP